jgi:hypothetical protein
MDQATEFAIAMCCAAGVASLFAILRRTMRSASTPSWIASVPTAYVMALALTAAFSASLYYLGATLNAFVPPTAGFFATFVIHICLVAAFMRIIPVSADDEFQPASSAHNGSRQVAQAAA